MRRWIFKAYGYKIAPSAIVYPQFFCGAGKGKLVMGDGSYINYRCFLDLGNDIIIGNHVSIAFNCTFTNSTHIVGGGDQRAGKTFAKKVVIEDGVWIGAHTTILPGVTIAKGCIIGAGSLVTKNTEENGLYLGTPAKRVKDLS